MLQYNKYYLLLNNYRRLFSDDHFGVGEALNETPFGGKGLIVRGTHRIFIGSRQV